MSPDLSTFISGGYFLTKRIARPAWVIGPMPDFLITLSSAITDIAPDTWADNRYEYDKEVQAAEFLSFGIPRDAAAQLANEFTRAVLEHGYLSNFFPTLPVARAFHRQSRDKNVLLVGIGLDPSLLPSLRAQLMDEINHGHGLIERVDAMIPIAGGGEVLGYEPLGFEGMTFHSWLGHKFFDVDCQQFGIMPNHLGFIDSFTDAVRVTEILKASGACPGIWEPWLVVRYESVDGPD